MGLELFINCYTCSGVNYDLETIRKLTVGIDNIQISQNEVKCSLKNVSFRLEELEERSHPFGSNKASGLISSHGDIIKDSLIKTGDFMSAGVEECSGPQAIPDHLIRQAQNMYHISPRPHENALVSLYTPSLIEIVKRVSSNLKLVNSEHNAWIQCNSKPSYNLKPDLFTAHHHLIHFGAAYENAPECTTARLFGKFSNWECRTSIHCIWEAKWKINMSAFGEICKYLQIAGETKRSII